MAETLKPWYAVATPHEDIREGRLAEAVFAANLWAVVQGTAPEVYLDSEEFFRKTFSRSSELRMDEFGRGRRVDLA